MIRPAVYSDDLYPLAVEFYKKANFPVEYDEQDLRNILNQIKETGLVLVAVEEFEIVGFIGGLITDYTLNKKKKVFQEAMWYVTPEFRGLGRDLYTSLVNVLKTLEIDYMVMACLNNEFHDVVDRFYKKEGFTLLEKHYLRTV